MLVDDRRRNEHQQVAFCPSIESLLEEISENRDVAQDRDFATRFGVFILEQTTDRQRVAALDQDIGIEGPRVDNRTGHNRPSENEG